MQEEQRRGHWRKTGADTQALDNKERVDPVFSLQLFGAQQWTVGSINDVDE